MFVCECSVHNHRLNFQSNYFRKDLPGPLNTAQHPTQIASQNNFRPFETCKYGKGIHDKSENGRHKNSETSIQSAHTPVSLQMVFTISYHVRSSGQNCISQNLSSSKDLFWRNLGDHGEKERPRNTDFKISGISVLLSAKQNTNALFPELRILLHKSLLFRAM